MEGPGRGTAGCEQRWGLKPLGKCFWSVRASVSPGASQGKATPCQLLCASPLLGMGKDSVIQKKEFSLFCGDLEVKVVRCHENKLREIEHF